MKRILLKVWDLPGNTAMLPVLVFICICFIIGAITGSVIAANGGDSTQIASLITDYTVSSDVSFWRVLANVFRFPIIILLCGFCVFGAVFIPAVVALRGFLLLFTMTSFVRIFGWHGLLFSAALFGIQCLLLLPCMLMLAAQGVVSASLLFSLASSKGKKLSGSIFSSSYFSRILVCVGVLLICTLAEMFITPSLVSAALGNILT